MLTELEVVYESFLSKITTFEYNNFTNEEMEIVLQTLLKGAFSKSKCLNKTVSIKWEFDSFSRELTDEEIEIISSWMVVEWLSPKIYTDTLLKQRMSSSDYKITSQANHLNELLNLRRNALKEARGLSRVYELDKFKESRNT